MARELGSNGRLPDLSNGQIVVAAGVGAGAVAALLTALSGDDERGSDIAARLEAARESALGSGSVLVEATDDRIEGLQDAQVTASDATAETGRRARKRARKLQAQTVERLTDQDVMADLAERATVVSDSVEHGSHKARRVARKAAEAARQTAESVRDAAAQVSELSLIHI